VRALSPPGVDHVERAIVVLRLLQSQAAQKSDESQVNATESQVPTVEIVDETPIGDAGKALEQVSTAGDLSSKAADTASEGAQGDPASSSATPPEEKKRGRPPGSGKPFEKKPRPRGDATLTAKELDQLRKNEVATLLLAEQRKTKALEEKLEDAQLRATIHTAERSEVIDDSITDACGFAAETLGNMAAAKWGPAARINDKQKTELATAWSRVAKLYLGQHAQYSPVAAALLATVAVVGEKYVDVQIAQSGSPRPSLVAQG
jgi:hypothetical protein